MSGKRALRPKAAQNETRAPMVADRNTAEKTFETTDLSTPAALSRVHAEPAKWAVFLDIDGTLLDLASTPESIVVPETLPGDLHRLSGFLGGALALVSGRALEYVDRLFEPYRFSVAGLHGAEMRGPDGVLIHAHASPHFARVKAELQKRVALMPGVVFEDKGAAVAAHFRLAPQCEAELGQIMHDIAEKAGPQWALQLGKFVYELRPAGASKGDAIERFMQDAPFAGRLPLALGDDLTDETMFAVVNARGGHSVRVGRPNASTCAVSTIESPAHVRERIAALFAT